MKIIIFVVGLVTLFVSADGTPQEAMLYAGRAALGPSIVWSDSTDWSHLGRILSTNELPEVGSVCVTGAWMMYDRPEYDSYGPLDYALVSGYDNECFPNPGMILSMQPLGSLEYSHGISMTLFQEKHFGGPGLPISNSRGPRFLESMSGPPMSLVVIGRSQWTIETTSGKTKKRYCLATNFDAREPLPICLVPDLIGLGLWAENVTISMIGKGCEPTVTAKEVALLENCKYFGEKSADFNENDRYRPRVLSENFDQVQVKSDKAASAPANMERDEEEEGDPSAPELPPPIFNGTCSGGKGGPIVKEFARLLSIRLNHDFTDDLQLLWPDQEHVYMTELLDMVYEIAMDVTPDHLVPHHYMMMIREYMINHLSLAWKGIKPDNMPVSEHLIKTVHADLDRCSMMLSHIAEDMADINTKYLLQDSIKSVYEEFARPKALDIVIDTTYVLGNLVLGLCHHVLGYTSNFWANFIHTFNALYLKPVIEEWKSMGLEEDFILGGFDYDLMYYRLASFATNAIETVPNLDPFQRQPGVILHPDHPDRGNETDSSGGMNAQGIIPTTTRNPLLKG